MTASFYGNARMVEILISANANLELIDINTNTAWQLALENSHNDCVQIILNEMGKLKASFLSRSSFCLAIFWNI